MRNKLTGSELPAAASAGSPGQNPQILSAPGGPGNDSQVPSAPDSPGHYSQVPSAPDSPGHYSQVPSAPGNSCHYSQVLSAPDSPDQDPQTLSALVRDLAALAMKLAVLFAVFWLMFHYIFGVYRNLSINMTPAFRDGDLVLYFRLDQDFAAGEIAVFSYEGRTMMGRVVAVEGDTVDFDSEGMLINGARVKEENIYYETTMFREGVTFPVKVGGGQIFVLGDNRPRATDSRIFGCINKKDVAGKVIGFLRRRNL